VSVTITYLLLLATVGMFIAFLHGMVHVLRVQHLLRLTSRSSHAAIDTTFPPADAYTPARAPETTLATRDVLHDHRDHDRAVRSHRVLQAIELGGLAAVARRHDCWIEVLVPVGEHLGPRSPLARIHGVDPSAVADDAVIERFLFGDERTMLQDPGFGFRQLVDISSRALSPAVNDPTTAVAALNRVVDLLERIGDCPDPTGWYTDLAGTVRLRIVQPGFERLARLGLEEIVRYGADSPQVTRSLAAAYDDLERVVLPEREPMIAALREQFMTAVSGSMPQPFLAGATHPDRLGLG
jgi:uncharacterized membrane protein